jgi:TRAP-type C4-dicarboxylate transport system permease small subunit
MSFRAANDQTTILAIPTWWAVAAMVPSFALLSAAGLYTAAQHWRTRTRASTPPAEAAP